jgi:intracellular septation protein A
VTDGPEREEPRSGLARAGDSSPLTARGAIDAIGGPLGIVESVLPPLVFVVYYQVVAIRQAPTPVDRPALIPIVAAPLVLAAVFVLLRLLRHQKVGGAVSGAALVAVSAVLVLVTGDANSNFIPGFVINGVYGLVFLGSVVVRRPLVGVVSGLLTSDTGWGSDPSRRRIASWLSLLWVALFAIRLAVELPLFLAGDEVVELGIARIVLGLPLYSIVLVVTVLVVQAVRRRPAA